MSFTSEFFEGNAQFTVCARVNICILGSYSILEIDFSPFNPSKNLASGWYVRVCGREETMEWWTLRGKKVGDRRWLFWQKLAAWHSRIWGHEVAKQPANRFSGIVLQHYATSPSQLDVYILPLLIAGQLGWINLPGVPSRETNSGLHYSKPTHYQLSYAAPLDWQSHIALESFFLGIV